MFMRDLAGRLARRVQLTTDGLSTYVEAVEVAFGGNVGFAQLVKLYAAERAVEARYSPPKCTGREVRAVQGAPDAEHVSTSYIERQNLSVRMGSRRFTRLTKRVQQSAGEPHAYAVAIHDFHYNFVRKHATPRTTPAVAAGLAERPLTTLDLVAMVER